MLTILVENIVLEGIHGYTAKEQNKTQPFRVDISIETKRSTPLGDSLEATLDYRWVKGIAETVIEKETHRLLETIAYRIASNVRSDPRVKKVRVTVWKLTIWKSGVPGVTISL